MSKLNFFPNATALVELNKVPNYSPNQLNKKQTHSPSQSAPTILVLKTRVGLWPWKKLGTLLFEKSRVQKTKVIVIQKEKRQPGLFSFWITMTLFFCTLLFAKSRVPEFLKVPDPKNILGRSDKLEQWVQIDWASNWYFKPFSIIGINST